MEFGSRALGNRSILANPCNPKMKDIINKKIKKRENFRPFAPAILEDKKYQWFGNKTKNPYMSAVELIKKDKRKYIPAVTHIDGTGRIQTVSKISNKSFYFIIKQFYKLSGVPILLNTSFNENEPIVMDFKDAINCFVRTKMDVLILNNIVIKR
jgi:Predicted carbamoyl transferase, NodU family